MSKIMDITGVVLAGGRATRMGGEDKGLMLLNGIPLWQHLRQRLEPQTGKIVISANRNLDIYRKSGLLTFSDTLPNYQGPLAGMLSVMEQLPDEWFLFCPCDTPFIPDNLAEKLWFFHHQSQVLWAKDENRDHPTLVLMHRSLRHTIRTYLESGERRVMPFLGQNKGLAILFSGHQEHFTNINTCEELASRQEKK